MSPAISIPLVKPEINTNVFVCPANGCGARCVTHIEFVEHWAGKHALGTGGVARKREMPKPQTGGMTTQILNKEEPR
jgi:hypothetical protein